jgi:hypothetical protein
MPTFGGKSRAAPLVWQRLGKVVNYIEPFCRSAAVLFACPEAQRPRVETINDIDAHISNLLRAIKYHPEKTAEAADWQVNEVDMHARHKHLLARIPEMRAALDADPKWCDPELAGWYIWGASAWIGSGWCEEGSSTTQLPALGGGGASNAGLNAFGVRAPSTRLPDLAGGTQWGTDEPNARAGRGVHSATARGPSQQLPDLSGARPDGGQVGHGVHNATNRTRLYDLFAALSARLRHVRVACGDWARICTPAVTYKHGLTGVFLDPPYPGYEHVYGSGEVWPAVVAWAVENGKRDDMRIAVCGYEGTAPELLAAGWEEVAWKSRGGYANQREDGENKNQRRERIWFSKACLRPGVNVGQIDLFARSA